jgi:hypothetical protein
VVLVLPVAVAAVLRSASKYSGCQAYGASGVVLNGRAARWSMCAPYCMGWQYTCRLRDGTSQPIRPLLVISNAICCMVVGRTDACQVVKQATV